MPCPLGLEQHIHMKSSPENHILLVKRFHDNETIRMCLIVCTEWIYEG